MPDLVVQSFAKGLDVRRLEVAQASGTLSKAINCHINKGGEIEKRKAFVNALSTSLPSGTGYTFGLAADDNGLYTFGSRSAGAVTLPSGISYQQLAHPTADDTAHAMTKLLDWTLYNAKIYAAAMYADNAVYHFYNGTRVTDWFDGKARGFFDVLPAPNGAYTANSVITSITVNGVTIANAVTASNNLATFAYSIAQAINSFSSAPEYTAVSTQSTVVIIAGTAGDSQNGLVVAVNGKSADVTVGNFFAMADGANNSSGSPGSTVLTLGEKLYTTADTSINFSATGDPTRFNTDAVGAGFFKPATHTPGASQSVALGSFLENLVVLAKSAVQVWHVEADDENNQVLTIIPDEGTTAPNANVTYKDGHVFLGIGGIVQVVPVQYTSRATIQEIGAPVNKEILEYIDTLSATVRDQAVATVEPREKRLWLAIGQRVYVYSLYADMGIAGWSRYDPGFQITDFALIRDKTYARAGDTVYLYGGSTFSTYDACAVTARIPYLDSGKPDGYKDLQSMDLAALGTWNVLTALDPNTVGNLTTAATIVNSTFDGGILPLGGRVSHIAVELHHALTEAAIISQFVLHYATDDAG